MEWGKKEGKEPRVCAEEKAPSAGKSHLQKWNKAVLTQNEQASQAWESLM
jgi:hypothetical protein